METNKIIWGDCIIELKDFPDNFVDAIITDPPYGLEFMGKDWDKFKEGHNIAGGDTGKDTPSARSKPTPAFYQLKNSDMLNFQNFTYDWAKECLRVLKPGGYLLSFGGTRTYHRMTCGIEDAGFEIRDMISWIYASGFPKSLNVYKQIEKVYKCGNTSINHNGKQETEHNLRPLSETNLQESESVNETERKILQSELQEQSLSESRETTNNVWSKESCLEGGSDLLQNSRELQRCEICKMSKEISCYVPKGWLCNGTQINNGEKIKEDIIENGSNTSYRPQSNEQQYRESYAICEQCRTQILRRYEGIGTALKPAQECIVVARKPLSEKNVALNVLKWGTGGINIDESRVGNDLIPCSNDIRSLQKWKEQDGRNHKELINPEPTFNQGRFPANIILDEEAGQMLDEQSGIKKGNGHWSKTKTTGFEEFGNGKSEYFGVGEKDTLVGGASRFFYCAKASKSERNFGCEEMEDKIGGGLMATVTGDSRNGNITIQKNNHPTVKPVKLIEYLVKLVSREGSIVLDPFLGSGTTAIACVKLNRNFIGIEKEPDYVKIAEARIKPYLEQTKL